MKIRIEVESDDLRTTISEAWGHLSYWGVSSDDPDSQKVERVEKALDEALEEAKA